MVKKFYYHLKTILNIRIKVIGMMGFILMFAAFLFIMLVVAPYFGKNIKNQTSFIYYLYYFVMLNFALLAMFIISQIFDVPI